MSRGLRSASGELLTSVVVVALACSGGPRPAAEPPPQTVTETAPGQTAASEPPAAPEATPAIPELRPPAPDVIIEPAEPEPDAEPTLAEAALLERQRRRQTGQPIAVINDANLQDHAVGQLTFMEDDAPDPSDQSAGTPADAEASGPDEQYWRNRVLEIRQRWADAANQVPELEDRVAELRRRFYETDDAYYRDTRIKPSWDRAIDLIAQTRAEAEAHRVELEGALDEGRLAGALPGWLREGVDLEPVPLEPQPDTHEPGEPKIVEPVEGGRVP